MYSPSSASLSPSPLLSVTSRSPSMLGRVSLSPNTSYPSSPSSSASSPSEDAFISSQTPDAQDIIKTVVDKRKNWKTAKGGGRVWPPKLEAALIEGLASYQPDDSRETRLLGRYPLRNKIISKHILNVTGEYRTAKQVGSRLQQLRESGDKRVRKLLSPPRRPGIVPSNQAYRSATDDSMSYNCSVSSDPSIIWIDIQPQWEEYPGSSTGSGNSRPIRSIDPTISWYHTKEISATSTCTVYANEQIVHSETTSLTRLQFYTKSESDFLYQAKLVPTFWDTLCQAPDPTIYAIDQTVTDTLTHAPIYSSWYRFRFPSGSQAIVEQSFFGDFASSYNGYVSGSTSDEGQLSPISEYFPTDVYLHSEQEPDFTGNSGYGYV